MAEPIKKSWAQRGKEAVAATPAPAFNIPEGFTKTTGGNATGSADRSVLTYRFSTPLRRPLGEDERVLAPGEQLIGKFIGTYEDSFKKTYYKFLQTEGPVAEANGKVVAVHGVTSVRNNMEDKQLNQDIFLGYIGLGVAKPGMSAPHLVTIAAK